MIHTEEVQKFGDEVQFRMEFYKKWYITSLMTNNPAHGNSYQKVRKVPNKEEISPKISNEIHFGDNEELNPYKRLKY